ncbi:heterokaryon incompatibility protein [Apiospora hydei]|uniref:Heterokaryon incompatibility protein n=1 Tax=Apiospora hydei TaxID=1337664 RepID=A0ABR1VT43_9PEZI
MSNFVYEPLTAPDAFRLLVLEPGAPEDALCCRILHTTHSRNLDYEALSYTWGSPPTGDEPAPTCLINEKTVPIRRNLYDALRHLRWRDYERVLWIDALCIDQSNVGERNHQVGRMRDIYSNAETVRVWLGLASKTSSIAMSWIDELASRRHRNSLGCRAASRTTRPRAAAGAKGGGGRRC